MSRYINDVKNQKILGVYEIGRFIEFVYEKEGIEKSFTIDQLCRFGPMYDGCWFVFGGVELPSWIISEKKKLSKRFEDIKSITEINRYSKKLEYGAYIDLEIIYKSKNGNTQSYLLHPQSHEEEVHEIVLLKNTKSKFKKEDMSDDVMPQELYSTKLYKKNLAFALKAHGEQKTPEGLPYAFHIVSVANEIINSLFMHHISYDEANVAIACALLHDVNEDTQEKVSRYDISMPSEDIVISGVIALTKDETLPSKQKQMIDSLKRLKFEPKCVQMVKLADRITNLAPAPLFWNKTKRKSYVEEAKLIYKALKNSNPYLAQKLQNKIDNYNVDSVDDSNGIPIKDKFLVFFTKEEEQLILDKNHQKYLKTFKAINRLSEYVLKKYEIVLFLEWRNINEFVVKNTKKLTLNYIVKRLNTKGLPDLNKQTDEKIAKYMSLIYDGEEVIVL
jgi:predicted nucleic acid-binding protein